MKFAQWQLGTRNSSRNECNSLLHECNLHNHCDSSLQAEHKHTWIHSKRRLIEIWKMNSRWMWLKSVGWSSSRSVENALCAVIETCVDQDWYFHYKLWYILETLPCGNEKNQSLLHSYKDKKCHHSAGQSQLNQGATRYSVGDGAPVKILMCLPELISNQSLTVFQVLLWIEFIFSGIH